MKKGVPKVLKTYLITDHVNYGKRMFTDETYSGLQQCLVKGLSKDLLEKVTYRLYDNGQHKRITDYRTGAAYGTNVPLGVQGKIQLATALMTLMHTEFNHTKVLDLIRTEVDPSVISNAPSYVNEGSWSGSTKTHFGAIRRAMKQRPAVSTMHDVFMGEPNADCSGLTLFDSFIEMTKLLQRGLMEALSNKMSAFKGIYTIAIAVEATCLAIYDFVNEAVPEDKSADPDKLYFTDHRFRDADLGSFLLGTICYFISAYAAIWMSEDKEDSYSYISRSEYSVADAWRDPNALKQLFVAFYKDKVAKKALFNEWGYYSINSSLFSGAEINPKLYENIAADAVYGYTIDTDVTLLRLQQIDDFFTDLQTSLVPLYLVHSQVKALGMSEDVTFDGHIRVEGKSYNVYPATVISLWDDNEKKAVAGTKISYSALMKEDTVKIDPVRTKSAITNFAAKYAKVIPLFSEFIETYFDMSDGSGACFRPTVRIRTRGTGKGYPSIYHFEFYSNFQPSFMVLPFKVKTIDAAIVDTTIVDPKTGKAKKSKVRKSPTILDGTSDATILDQYRIIPDSIDEGDEHISAFERKDADDATYYIEDHLTQFDKDLWRASMIFFKYETTKLAADGSVFIKYVPHEEVEVLMPPSYLKLGDLEGYTSIQKVDGTERMISGNTFQGVWFESIEAIPNLVDRYFAVREYELPLMTDPKLVYMNLLRSLYHCDSPFKELKIAKPICTPVYNYQSFNFGMLENLKFKDSIESYLRVTRKQALPSGIADSDSLMKKALSFKRTIPRYFTVRIPVLREMIANHYLTHQANKDKHIIYQTTPVTCGKKVLPLVTLFDEDYLKGHHSGYVYMDIVIDLSQRGILSSACQVREVTSDSITISITDPLPGISEPEYGTNRRVCFVSDNEWTYKGTKHDDWDHDMMDLVSPFNGVSDFSGFIQKATEYVITSTLISLAEQSASDSGNERSGVRDALASDMAEFLSLHTNTAAPLTDVMPMASNKGASIKDFIDSLNGIVDVSTTGTPTDEEKKQISEALDKLTDCVYGMTVDQVARRSLPIPVDVMPKESYSKTLSDLWMGYKLANAPKSVIADSVIQIPDLVGENGAVIDGTEALKVSLFTKRALVAAVNRRTIYASFGVSE